MQKINDDIYVEIKLFNPTKYDVSDIKYNYTNGQIENIEYVDYETIRVHFKINSYYNEYFYINLTEIQYGNESIGQAYKASNLQTYITIVKDGSVRSISTPSDLANIENGYIYQLENDLDMTGVIWNPNRF